jgi:hypothetical protein
MKKIIFCLFFFTGSTAMAIKPSEWTILQRNYTYNNSVLQGSILPRDLKILDIAVTADNKFWILTNKDLYVLRERGNELFLEHPLETRSIQYQISKTSPRLYTNYWQNGLVLQAGEKYWATDDYQQWVVNPMEPTAYSLDFATQGKHLKQTAEMLLLPDSSYCASGMFESVSLLNEPEKTPGIMCYAPGSGKDPVLYLLSDMQAHAARQREAFWFTDIHRAKDNTLWVRGNKDGQGLWGLLQGELRLKAIGVMDVASDDNRDIYVSTKDALYKIDNDNELVKLPDMGSGFKYMTCDKKGFLWLVPMPPQSTLQVKPNVLIRYNLKANTYFPLMVENCPIKGEIRKIVVDNNNVKYILTDEGIYIIDDASPKDIYWNIITAGNNGAEVLNDNYWETLYKGEDGHYISLVQDKKLNLRSFQNNQWTSIGTYDRPRGFYIINDIAEQNNKIYLATNYGFDCLEDGRFQTKEYDKKQFSNRINAMLKDDENNLWLGSNKGIAKFDGTNYTYFNKKNTPELTNESIVSMCSDRDKKIFFGTENGLAVWDKDTWTFYDKKSGLDSKKIVAVVSNNKGQTFIASSSLLGGTGVINIYEAGELHSEPLPEKILVKKMLVDKHDNLWIQAHTSVVCRKADGKYITYDFKNSPIPKNLVVKNIFLFEDELRVIIDEDELKKDDGLPKHTRPMDIFGMDVNEFQLKTFMPMKQVLIYDIK